MKIYGGSLISDPKNIEKVGNFYKETVYIFGKATLTFQT